MKSEPLEMVRGSGNTFRDLGYENADVEQCKAILAAEIIKVLDRGGFTVRAAHSHTAIAAADFSRIRNADLDRFTVDRLISIINRFGSRVEVKVKVKQHVEKKRPMVSIIKGPISHVIEKSKLKHVAKKKPIASPSRLGHGLR